MELYVIALRSLGKTVTRLSGSWHLPIVQFLAAFHSYQANEIASLRVP